jgi:hypothetical protein
MSLCCTCLIRRRFCNSIDRAGPFESRPATGDVEYGDDDDADSDGAASLIQFLEASAVNVVVGSDGATIRN